MTLFRNLYLVNLTFGLCLITIGVVARLMGSETILPVIAGGLFVLITPVFQKNKHIAHMSILLTLFLGISSLYLGIKENNKSEISVIEQKRLKDRQRNNLITESEAKILKNSVNPEEKPRKLLNYALISILGMVATLLYIRGFMARKKALKEHDSVAKQLVS